MATIHPFPGSGHLEATLCRAIDQRRLVSFTLHGYARRAEPHDLGVVNGVTKLFFYQVGGGSQSARPFGWRWAVLSEIRDLRVLEERFAGARDAGSQRRVRWDRLIASVSRVI